MEKKLIIIFHSLQMTKVLPNSTQQKGRLLLATMQAMQHQSDKTEHIFATMLCVIRMLENPT